MKAMILAAGLGTRLLPLTKKKPKPLFPLVGRPLIDILIRRLESAGCSAVMINTHHLAPMIEAFVESQNYGIPVLTRHEKTILGTGGGIKNVEDFWEDSPLLVINGDIVSSIDLKAVYGFHLNQKNPVTMVLHDHEKYNHVWLDSDNRVRGFGHREPCPPADRKEETDFLKVAYTGVQVLDPVVLRFIPPGVFYNIIDTFCEMLRQGLTISGFVVRNHYWHDIGTLEGYGEADKDLLVRKVFEKAFALEVGPVTWSSLKGDGSDRRWFRVTVPPTRPDRKKPSIIVVDHGFPAGAGVCEADAFAAIGRHLHEKGVPVPTIFAYDRPSGLIALEDVGDVHLQQVVHRSGRGDEVAVSYRRVIDKLILMATEGAKGFDPNWAYQTPYYDRELILEKEARYFVEAFLNGYLNLETPFESLEDDFRILADRAVDHPYTGFLHRDFQSRNILVRGEDCAFIDFQGGRIGPLQYDLASLLIDPYVALAEDLQATLLDYYVEQLSRVIPVERDLFVGAYQYCAINRNLQILGAFAFLSGPKGKKDFEAYIPAALSSLQSRMAGLDPGVCPRLRRLVKSI